MVFLPKIVPCGPRRNSTWRDVGQALVVRFCPARIDPVQVHADAGLLTDAARLGGNAADHQVGATFRIAGTDDDVRHDVAEIFSSVARAGPTHPHRLRRSRSARHAGPQSRMRAETTTSSRTSVAATAAGRVVLCMGGRGQGQRAGSCQRSPARHVLLVHSFLPRRLCGTHRNCDGSTLRFAKFEVNLSLSLWDKSTSHARRLEHEPVEPRAHAEKSR